jgi:nucleotide-binding universal stress UspA family protein
MFQTILVPLDGSADAECALPLACSVARHAKAKLRLVRVLPDLADEYFWAPEPGTVVETDLRQHDFDAVRHYLQTVAHRIETLGNGNAPIPVACDVVPEQDDISQSIRNDAVRSGADLIVMINHGRGVLGRFLHGSIADKLVGSLDVPVLLVPPRPTRPDVNCETQLQPDHEPGVRHILVALDGTLESEQILSPALTVSQAMGANLTLVRVVASPPPACSEPSESPESIDAVRADAPRYLEAVAQRLRASGAIVSTRVLVGTQAASELLKESHSDDEVLALETEARRGLARLLHPSVVDQVVRDTLHPVLVLRRSTRSPVKA